MLNTNASVDDNAKKMLLQLFCIDALLPNFNKVLSAQKEC